MNSPNAFTLEDARRALSAVLSDPDFDTVAPHPAVLAMVQAALRSPRALLYLLRGREGAALPASPWARLIERGLRVSAGHPDWTDLASYLRARPGLPKFNRALLENRPGAAPFNLSDTQERVWSRLDAFARLYFENTFVDRVVQPRLIPLLAGPSGAGKSWLVRQFAMANGWPFLRLTFADWLPRGSKNQPDTFTQLGEFLLKHEEAVIQVDELDKVGVFGSSEWTSAILLEIFALLDRSLFENHCDAENFLVASLRLKHSTFLVGTGTWQKFLSGPATRSIGFAAPSGTAAGRIRMAGIIPEELLNRFHPEILMIEPPGEAELRRMAEIDGLLTDAEALGIEIDFKGGAETGLGVRWLESVATNLALKADDRPLDR